ncbi:uncharacterized protein TNCV_4124761 [Trichonephila clavipes]|nr:uncharacterized protein TNCV_4124761 [Trichonephila clavipes]
MASWTTPELSATTPPHQREDVSALDRFSVHHCPTRRVFSGTGLELVTKPATIRCLYHSATAATNDGTKTPIGHVYERKNRWNPGILTITNRSVSNSECGPVCDRKTVVEVSKNGRCYPTTNIRSTKSHNPSPRPISDNKCAKSEGQYCQSTGFGAHSCHRNTNFETNYLQETQS